MPNAGFSFLNIARENGLSTADAIQNANNIQKYLATPEADRKRPLQNSPKSPNSHQDI